MPLPRAWGLSATLGWVLLSVLSAIAGFRGPGLAARSVLSGGADVLKAAR